MKPIIYKTYPRLFVLGTTFIGSVFFGLLAWLTWKSSGVHKTSIAYIGTIFFVLGSIIALYCFITIRIIELSVERIRISYLMLPFHRTFLLSEIRSISQTSREAEVNDGFSRTTTFTVLKTTIQCNDGKQIKLETVGASDFKELEKGFRKCKNKDGHFTPGKRTFWDYMLDNVDGLVWVVVMIILTIGLTYGLLTQK
jgi:hypothetical protein